MGDNGGIAPVRCVKVDGRFFTMQREENKMIFCVYMNPTIDKTVYFDIFRVGGTNRPDKIVVDAGGKGINVAVELATLGQPVKVVGVMTSNDREFFEERLNAQGVLSDFVIIGKSARVNTKLFDRSNQRITEVNEAGPELSADVLDAVRQKIFAAAEEGDIVVLTGSLPRGCPTDFYAMLIRELHNKNIRSVLDADGDALKAAVKERPYMVKPNIDELSMLMGDMLKERDEIEHACKQLHEQGIRIVAVSMGADGAMISDGNGICYAQPMKVDILSTVGAGDSLVAGMVARDGMSLQEMLRSGVAAATGSITLEGTKLCTRELYDKYYPLVRVLSIDDP